MCMCVPVHLLLVSLDCGWWLAYDDAGGVTSGAGIPAFASPPALAVGRRVSETVGAAQPASGERTSNPPAQVNYPCLRRPTELSQPSAFVDVLYPVQSTEPAARNSAQSFLGAY